MYKPGVFNLPTQSNWSICLNIVENSFWALDASCIYLFLWVSTCSLTACEINYQKLINTKILVKSLTLNMAPGTDLFNIYFKVTPFPRDMIL